MEKLENASAGSRRALNGSFTHLIVLRHCFFMVCAIREMKSCFDKAFEQLGRDCLHNLKCKAFIEDFKLRFLSVLSFFDCFFKSKLWYLQIMVANQFFNHLCTNFFHNNPSPTILSSIFSITSQNYKFSKFSWKFISRKPKFVFKVFASFWFLEFLNAVTEYFTTDNENVCKTVNEYFS